jgi:hypothetical protein
LVPTVAMQGYRRASYSAAPKDVPASSPPPPPKVVVVDASLPPRQVKSAVRKLTPKKKVV